MRQPDIEIYIKDAHLAKVSTWLESSLNCQLQWSTKGSLSQAKGASFSISWFHKAAGSWHCLLLESDQTPWTTDLDCAIAASLALGCEVRCSPGAWEEVQGEADADRWIKVNGSETEEFIWRA